MFNQEDSEQFIRRLKEVRTEQGLSLRRLGSMTGLGHGYLSEIESGKHSPRLHTVFKIIRCLGFTVDEFFNWK